VSDGIAVSQPVQELADELLDLSGLSGGAVHREEPLKNVQRIAFIEREHMDSSVVRFSGSFFLHCITLFPKAQGA